MPKTQFSCAFPSGFKKLEQEQKKSIMEIWKGYANKAAQWSLLQLVCLLEKPWFHTALATVFQSLKAKHMLHQLIWVVNNWFLKQNVILNKF